MVIVDEDQLSLAIGKRGKNARLAVKLTNHKIDIKTREDIEEMGLDYDQLLVDAARRREELRREHERREIERLKKEAKEAEERRLEAAAKLVAQSKEKNAQFEEEDIIPEEMQEHVQDMIRYEMAMETEAEKTEAPKEEETVTTAPAEEPVSEPKEEPEVQEEIQEEEPEADEPQEEVQEPVVQKRRHADLEDMANKSTYVSVFEKLADTSKPKEQEKSRKKKKKTDDDEYKVRNKDLEKQLKQEYAMDNRPIYTEEELAEIEEQLRREEEREYDIDYDEYDDYDQYYDDEDNI
jgi:N utilization substance protein A